MTSRLYTLGRTHLVAESGLTNARVLAQPKRLALLAYLAVASPGAFQRRDKLLALFWPEFDEKHARWALNQAVRLLRSELGPAVIPSRGTGEIGVNRDLLWCDAVGFQEACVKADWSEAEQLYGGEFLDGLHVADCLEFSDWLESRRADLRRLAAHASWSLVDQLHAQGALRAAIEGARKSVRLAPEDEHGIRRLITLLDVSGDRAGAVQVYEKYAHWLSENLGVAPAPETVDTIRAVKSRAAAPATTSSPPVTREVAVRDRGGTHQDELGHRVRTPSGEPDRRDRLRWRIGRSWVGRATAGLGIVTFLATMWQWGGRGDTPPSLAPSIGAIAVLPLSNRTQDPEQDYFVDGMHEALIAELSKIGALRVTSRTSTMGYRETNKPMREVARELLVEGLIKGSVLQDGERVRITVELIHGPTDRHLWGETFDRDLRGILDLQGDIARAIAERIGAGSPLLAPGRTASARPVVPAAHHAYLRGRYQFGMSTVPALHMARQHFLRALDLDPTYAAAYAGLADVYNRLAIQGSEPPREVYPLAKAALVKALDLDRTLSEAHALQGVLKFRFEWDWEGSERHLMQAIDLEPNSTRAHLAYGTYLLVVARLEEGLASSVKFQELDPLSPFASQNLAWHQYHHGRYDQAIPLLHRALHLSPDSGAVYSLLGQNHAARGAHGEAVAACDTGLRLTPGDDAVLSMCGAVYAEAGRRRDALDLLDRLQVQSSQRRYIDPYRLASLAAAIYTSPSENDRILSWLMRAYHERSANLCAVKVSPAFHRLHTDSRFQDLLRRMGFPQ